MKKFRAKKIRSKERVGRGKTKDIDGPGKLLTSAENAKGNLLFENLTPGGHRRKEKCHGELSMEGSLKAMRNGGCALVLRWTTLLRQRDLDVIGKELLGMRK